MAGTTKGGKRAAATNKKLYGDNFYIKIGSLGGKAGRNGGFYANRELARIAGARGGRISRRGKVKRYKSKPDTREFILLNNEPFAEGFSQTKKPKKRWWHVN